VLAFARNAALAIYEAREEAGKRAGERAGNGAGNGVGKGAGQLAGKVAGRHSGMVRAEEEEEVSALLGEVVPPLWLVVLRVRILFLLLRFLRRLVTFAKVIYI